MLMPISEICCLDGTSATSRSKLELEFELYYIICNRVASTDVSDNLKVRQKDSKLYHTF